MFASPRNSKESQYIMHLKALLFGLFLVFVLHVIGAESKSGTKAPKTSRPEVTTKRTTNKEGTKNIGNTTRKPSTTRKTTSRTPRTTPNRITTKPQTEPSRASWTQRTTPMTTTTEKSSTNDCSETNKDRTTYPKSACVKPEYCEGYGKENQNDSMTQRVIEILTCKDDREKICCPHSSIKKTDTCGESTIPATKDKYGTDIGVFPWIAHIVPGFDYVCIISKRHILTSAHIVLEKSKESISILSGLGPNEERFQSHIEKISIHPNYSNISRINDIAVLTLDRDFIFNDYIKPICLPPPEGIPDIIGKDIIIYYSGDYRSRSGIMYRTYYEHPVLDTSKCMKKFDPNHPDKILCINSAKTELNTPVKAMPMEMPSMHYHNRVFYVVGIPTNCFYNEKPCIYTKVSAYLDWINAEMESQ